MRAPETTIGHDQDHDLYAEPGDGTGYYRITHFQGDTVETADQYQLDTGSGLGDPLTSDQLRGLAAGIHALLERVETPGPVPPPCIPACISELNRVTELDARQVAARFTLAQVEAFIQAAPVFRADRATVAAYSRAAHLLAAPLQGPAGLYDDYTAADAQHWAGIEHAAWWLSRDYQLAAVLAAIVDGHLRGGVWRHPDHGTLPVTADDQDSIDDLTCAGLVDRGRATELGHAVLDALRGRDEVAA